MLKIKGPMFRSDGRWVMKTFTCENYAGKKERIIHFGPVILFLYK